MYWYIALLARPPKRRSCDGLEERGSHRQAHQLGAQAVDDPGGADLARRQRLERNEDEAGIRGTAAAGKGNHILDGRVVLDHAPDLLNGVVHGGEGRILRPLHSAGERSCVLLREKTLGYLDDQHHVERYGEKKYDEGEGRIVERPMQAAAI